MLKLAANQSPRHRALVTTPNYAHALSSHGIFTPHFFRSGACVNNSCMVGLSRAIAISSRYNKSTSVYELYERAAPKQAKIPKQSTSEPPEPKTKAWYNHYLSKKLRRPIKPQTRYAQLDTVALGSKLHSLSRQDPLEHFDSKPSGHADLQEAGPYLDLYITRHSPESDDALARTRERYVRDRPGSRALAWSLS